MSTDNLQKTLNKLLAHYEHLMALENPTIKESEAAEYMSRVVDILMDCEGHYDAICERFKLAFEEPKQPEPVRERPVDAAIGAVAGMAATGMIDMPAKEEPAPSAHQEVCPVDKFLDPETMDDVYIDEEEMALFADLIV